MWNKSEKSNCFVLVLFFASICVWGLFNLIFHINAQLKVEVQLNCGNRWEPEHLTIYFQMFLGYFWIYDSPFWTWEWEQRKRPPPIQVVLPALPTSFNVWNACRLLDPSCVLLDFYYAFYRSFSHWLVAMLVFVFFV